MHICIHQMLKLYLWYLFLYRISNIFTVYTQVLLVSLIKRKRQHFALVLFLHIVLLSLVCCLLSVVCCFVYCALCVVSTPLLFSNTRSDTHVLSLLSQCLCVQKSLHTCGRKWIKWLEPPKNDKFNRKSLHVNALIGHNPIMAQGYASKLLWICLSHSHSLFRSLSPCLFHIYRCMRRVKNIVTHPFVVVIPGCGYIKYVHKYVTGRRRQGRPYK